MTLNRTTVDAAHAAGVAARDQGRNRAAALLFFLFSFFLSLLCVQVTKVATLRLPYLPGRGLYAKGACVRICVRVCACWCACGVRVYARECLRVGVLDGYMYV